MEERAKYEVKQMLRYLSDGTPISPRTSPRSPDLSHSDELLQEKYDELNRLMLSHIAQRKTLGHLYSTYDLDFKKARPRSVNSPRNEKETQQLKRSAKRLTEIVDHDRGVRLKVWEMPSDSEDDEGDGSNYDEEIHDGDEFFDDASEHTCNSTVNSTLTIREVNTDGEEIESGDEKATTTSSKSKRVSFVETKEGKTDPIPCYDPNSLEALILKDILRKERKTPKHTDSGISFKTKPGKQHRRYKSKKGSPRQKKSSKKDIDPEEKSPRQRVKIKSALDNHLDTSNSEIKQWIREKNKLARKKLKEERRKERAILEKEHNAANEKAAKLIESDEKVKQWAKEKQKQALLQRKFKQRVEEIQRRNAAIKRTEESIQRRNNHIKEEFELRKSAIRRRKIRINRHKEKAEDNVEVTKKEDEFPLEPANARLVQDEKRQAKAAKKKYGVSVRETLRKAAKQLNSSQNSTDIVDTNNLNETNIKTPNGNPSKNHDKINKRNKGSKPSGQKHDRMSEISNEDNGIDPVNQVRKTNRMTYNTWIKIKREGDNSKRIEDEAKKKIDPDLETLLPTLSKERIRRATESKRITDTGLQRSQTPTGSRPSSGNDSYRNLPDSSRGGPQRPKSARKYSDKLPQRPGSAKTTGSSSSHRSWRNDNLNVVLEGERPEPQGCELPDNSSCQSSKQSGPKIKVTDDVDDKKHSKNNYELDVINTDSVFITA